MRSTASWVIVSDSLLSLLGEPEAYSLVPTSIVSWRMILAICRRVRFSFLLVLSVSSDLSSQHLISLLVYHFLIIILAVAVFGVEQFVIIFCWHLFHDLVVSCSTGSLRRILRVSNLERIRYCISSVVLAGSCFRQPSFTFELGVPVGFLVLVHLRSARAPSQVNGRSSPHYDISSLSQSLRKFIPRRLLSGSNFIVFSIIKI